MASAQDVMTLSLPQVIDLALSSPEVGSVNFKILHNLLHIIIQQLQMTNTNVEFRGKEGEKVKMLLAACKGKQPTGLLLTEFSVTADEKGQKTRTEIARSDTSKVRSPPSDPLEEIVVLVEPDETKTPQLTICLTKKTITDIQDDIENLKQVIGELVELPKNSSLLQALKNKDKPVVEMFQIMSVAKRVDAAESGLQKLASLVEDLTGEIQFAQFQNADYGAGGEYDADQYDEFGQPIESSKGEDDSPKGSSPQKSSAQGAPAVAKSKTQAGDGEKRKPSGVLKIRQGAPGGGQTDTAEGGAIEDPSRSPKSNAAMASVTPEGTRAPIKKPPDLIVRIGNSEKRLQAIEDTLKTYGIPPPIVPQIKYPTRIDLPPIVINKSFFSGASPTQSPMGQPSDTAYQHPSISPSFERGTSLTSAVRSPQQIGPDGIPVKTPNVAQKELSPNAKKEAKRDEEIARMPASDAVAALQRDINKIKKEIKKIKANAGGGGGGGGGRDGGGGGREGGGGGRDGGGGGRDTTDDSAPSNRPERRRPVKRPHAPVHDEAQIGDLEAKVKDSADTLLSMDQNFNNQILALQNQFSTLEIEVVDIMEKITSALPGGDSGVESIGDLFKKIQGLQIDIESIAETTTSLVTELTNRKSQFEELTEQVELLKTIKADKEDLEDALADKADKCAINRKVSHDQFDTACDELSRGIEEALEKLTNQELLWQQALDEIQFEIANKLDKMELGPLRDFINNKLRMLQERMKSLTALKKEQEAAGTKSKFLRNVNCISCDKDVVMRKQMDASLMPQPRALPPNRSMAPYLAYELDALRKQQKTLANSRNLNHFESAISGGKSPRTDDHVCNRYCGGSHTVTTPQQRVTRMGHFLDQWGPGAVPTTDTQPTKEAPKQERKSSLAEPGAGGDQKKASIVAEVAPDTVSQQEKKGSKSSIRSGSAPHLGSATHNATPEASKAGTPPSAGGPDGEGKGSIRSQEKVKTPTASVKGSQGSVRKTSKGSIAPSIKSKQGTIHGSKEAISVTEKPKDIPEEIPEETRSEVEAAESPPAKEPSVQVVEATEEVAPVTHEEEKAPDEGEGEPKPDTEVEG